MMQDHRVVAVTFVGRRQTLEILASYLEWHRDIVDEWILCWNVREPSDEDFVRALHRRLAPWTRLVYKGVNEAGAERKAWNTHEFHEFYNELRDDKTVYLKLDDDIVWMEPDAIPKLLRFRLEHPEFAVVSGNVINNVLMSHLHQRMGLLGWEEVSGWHCNDSVGWRDGAWAANIHRRFLASIDSGDISRWKFNQYFMHPGERFSINCVALMGADLAKFAATRDDEHFVSVELSALLNKPAVWFGQAVFCHFAFAPQADYLQATSLLDQYRKLSGIALEPMSSGPPVTTMRPGSKRLI